jgi:hypothetical protein
MKIEVAGGRQGNTKSEEQRWSSAPNSRLQADRDPLAISAEAEKIRWGRGG